MNNRFVEAEDDDSNIVELPARWEHAAPRHIAPAELDRFEQHLAEILAGLGMDLGTPGTRDTPRRFLQALVDATAGYDGDAKLRTAFPAERPDGVAGTHSQVVEGPISFLAASHLCTQMRGVSEESSRTVTTFWRGGYDNDADLRREFLDEVRARRTS